MEIIKNEGRKVFGNLVFGVVFIGFIILNGVFFWYQMGEENSYQPENYAKLYEDLEGMDLQEAYDKIDSLSNSIRCRYTNSMDAEETLYQDVKKELEDGITYKEYLNHIKETASDLSSISIFAESNSYDTRNNKKTINDFNVLLGHQLSVGASKGINQLSDFLFSDFLILFLIFIMAGILVMTEKEAGVKNLLRTSYYGHGALAAAKLAVMLIGSLLAEIFIYGSDYLLAGQAYGFGNLSRYIQSVYGFRGSSLNITAGQYLLLFFAAKFLVYSTVSAIVYLISIMSKSAVPFILCSGFIIVINVFCFVKIDGAGYLSFLKYNNLAAYINTKLLLSKYRNFDLFGYPIHYGTIFLYGNGILILFCSILGLWKFSRKESGNLSAGKRKFIAFPNFKQYETTNLLAHESYKIFISGKVLFVMILFLVFFYVTYVPVAQRSMGKDISYYRQYALKYEGTLSQEKEMAIEKEYNYYQSQYEEKNRDPDSMSKEKAAEIQEITNHLSAISLLEEQVQYLKKHPKDWILYDTGYQFLTGGTRSGETDLTQGLLSVFMVIACLTCVFSMEYENKMNLLLETAYKGRKNTMFIKLCLSAIILIILYAVIYGSYFWDVFSSYGTSGLKAPAASLPYLSQIPESVSLFQYLIVICVMRFVGLLIEGACIFFLSCKTKSFIKTVLTAIGIFILPMVFSLTGIRTFEYFLLTPLIKGNIFYL